MQDMVIDIKSGNETPRKELSNFYPHKFVYDGVECASMEGLLQSLKTKNKELQLHICTLEGKTAKNFFHKKPQNIWWKITGKLYWKGKRINRFGDEYQIFLDGIYDALYQNSEFRQALCISYPSKLIHSIGKTDVRKTVLTEYEFISRLLKCRERAIKENEGNIS